MCQDVLKKKSLKIALQMLIEYKPKELGGATRNAARLLSGAATGIKISCRTKILLMPAQHSEKGRPIFPVA